MEIQLATLLADNPMLLLFSVIGLGYLLGNVKIAGIEGGPVIGVLLVGLVFGHFGFDAPAGASGFGFALFIFSVGIQAGPTFFSAFMADGARYIALALVVAISALGLAFLLSTLIGLDYGFGAGLLAGALTSTPTLAGAADAVQSGMVTLPEGVTSVQAVENINVGYAITYLFGTIGIILAVRFFPGLIGLDLPAEAANLARERGLGKKSGKGRTGGMLPIIRAYRAHQEMIGKSVAQLRLEQGIEGKGLKLKRGKKLLDLEAELVIEEGDLFSVIASIKDHAESQGGGLEEVLDPDLLGYQVTTQEIILTEDRVVGKSLADLDMPQEYGCFAAALMRASIELPIDSALPLQKGDRLEVIGEKGNLKRLTSDIGYVEKELEKTDLATFAFGMIGGILLGLVTLALGDFSIGLGTAGGLLIVGIVIGYLGSVMPTFGRVPAPARYVLMELGLMLFMAAVGLSAGGGVVEALASVGPAIILSGVVVTLAPAAIGYFVGRRVLGLNPALLLGSLTGAMTSTPALNVVTDAARSAIPALGYAGTYTFANVLLTFAGALMMTL